MGWGPALLPAEGGSEVWGPERVAESGLGLKLQERVFVYMMLGIPFSCSCNCCPTEMAVGGRRGGWEGVWR